jgi:hypothetical protein
MKQKLLISLMVGIMALNCLAQDNGKWDKLGWLTGEWKGDGSGEPGNGSRRSKFQDLYRRKQQEDHPPMIIQFSFCMDHNVIGDQ